ncbi:MAG: hypothetical protein KF795_33060 [Labilithrix sp.]|nr:hypothetical protein [Labilithrix sp.]
MSLQKPNLRASFVLGADNRPEYVERDGLRHYKIRLCVEGAPVESASVTYRLHSSYWDPVREVFDPEHSFAENFTSYGDFNVSASVSGSSRAGLILDGQLSDLLEASHGNSDKAIADAITDIRDH